MNGQVTTWVTPLTVFVTPVIAKSAVVSTITQWFNNKNIRITKIFFSIIKNYSFFLIFIERGNLLAVAPDL
ncbi:hypothetical protein [Candidatus Pelagibacter communis]|uniref:hypothetical protein n=1 Tax=Pelagibacter ubique TaxID=198252 RepID=UPI000B7DB875|nr:hypothetical protein [Candidatus Pelagibacter ubique]